MISRSVAQIAIASMRTRTSAFFGTGTGLSVSRSSPEFSSTQAFIRSGIGKSGLVLTPAGAYSAISLTFQSNQRLEAPSERPPRRVREAGREAKSTRFFEARRRHFVAEIVFFTSR